MGKDKGKGGEEGEVELKEVIRAVKTRVERMRKKEGRRREEAPVLSMSATYCVRSKASVWRPWPSWKPVRNLTRWLPSTARIKPGVGDLLAGYCDRLESHAQ